MREMIFGARQQPAKGYNPAKEDLSNAFRNLKITNNITRDENIRLKTKA